MPSLKINDLRLKEARIRQVGLAPFDPPLDDTRNRAAIAQYLTPQIFLLWLRSLLAQEPPRAAGGDWDSDESGN